MSFYYHIYIYIKREKERKIESLYKIKNLRKKKLYNILFFFNTCSSNFILDHRNHTVPNDTLMTKDLSQSRAHARQASNK